MTTLTVFALVEGLGGKSAKSTFKNRDNLVWKQDM